MILNPLVRIRGRSTLGHLQFASMVHYKVVINWPEVVTTQVDADVDLSKYTMSLQPDGYVQFCKDGKQTSLHRMVMGLTRGDGKHVDHINGDKLDNRRCNLRIITHTVAGLHWTDKPSHRYDTKEEAALPYNTRALQMFPHATLNIIL